MKNKKNLILIAVPLAVVLMLVAVLASFSNDSDSDVTTVARENPLSDSYNTTSTDFEATADLYYFSVNAPENATVIFDGKEVPYNKTVQLYQIFAEKPDGHRLTVSKYGFETVTKDISFEGGANSEIEIEMTATQDYITEAENIAKDFLLKIVDVCNKGDGDLSDIDFFNDEDKAAVQKAVDLAIADMDVDTEDYITGEIVINNCSCDGMTDSSKTLSPDNFGKGSIVNFTVEYTYTWNYNGENYKDYGVDSEVHRPFVTVEYIDGQWYLKDIYICFRKSVH